MSPPQVPVKKLSEAHGAHCEDCDLALGCQYWDLGRSVALHRRGCPTHRVILWRYAA